jgi:hypothetical protein
MTTKMIVLLMNADGLDASFDLYIILACDVVIPAIVVLARPHVLVL